MESIYSAADHEAIVLKSVWDSISGMVNFNVFEKFERVEDTTMTFKTDVHQRLFNILLSDFVSAPKPWPFGLAKPPKETPEASRNIMFHLGRITKTPILNPAGSEYIRQPLEEFQAWLEKECFVEKVWLPSIELETNIRVKRIAFIKICGNIAKHNFARLSYSVDDICAILNANGGKVSRDECFMVIEEFYDWFHNDLFAYHSSAIAEFLNNVRWGLYDYLRPVFKASYTPGEWPAYSYKYPADCQNKIGKSMFWNLMNDVRSEPYMPRFEVTRFLKMRY